MIESDKSKSAYPECAFPELRGGGSQTHSVFNWRGGLWLGLNGDAAVRAIRWLKTDLSIRMVEQGFMPAMSTPAEGLPGFELGLQFESQFLPVRPEERSAAILKQGALQVLEMARQLDEAGWVINHLEPGQFGLDEHGRPLFIGLAAIFEKADRKFPFADFASLFLCPLELVGNQRGVAGLVRRAGKVGLTEYRALSSPWASALLNWAGLNQLLNQSPFGGLIHSGQFWQFARFAWRERRHRQRFGKPADAPWTGRLLRSLQRRVKRLDISGVKEKWSTHHCLHDIPALCRAQEDWRKHCEGPHSEQIIDVLEKSPCGTLLDLGANQGYFSFIAAHMGFRVTALDTDSGAIDHLYSVLVEAGFPLRIRPAVVDFTQFNPDERGRFKSDVVLALGFTHHMRLDQELTWPEIAEALAGLTGQLLITEFKIDTLARSSRGPLDSHVSEDYTLGNFLAALEDHFDDVRLGEITRKNPGGGCNTNMVKQNAGGNRQLILCRK